jgi:CheY-specific phosphatase CheX
MSAIMLIKGSGVARTEVAEAVSKFLKIFGEDVVFDDASSVSQAIGLMEMRQHDLVLLDEDLSQEDVNILTKGYNDLDRKPLVVCCQNNLSLLKSFIGDDNIKVAPHGFSKGFVFDFLRSVIVNSDRKIDPRVLGGIMRGIVKVVYNMSGLTLTPQPVKSARSKIENNDATAICSFYGDGLQGSLIAATTDDFVQMIGSAVFSLPPESISPEIKNDLLLEILNQLVGALRQELTEFGYELTPTVFFVAAGEKHSYLSRSNGKYFDMPFLCENRPFNVTFCYDIYSDFLRHAESRLGDSGHTKYLDVRLLNLAIKAVVETIDSNLGVKARHVKEKIYELENYTSPMVSVAHGAGPGANYTFVMSLEARHAAAIASKLLFMPPESVSLDMVADSCGELLNQIVAQFRGRSETIGYPFRTVFHGDFSQEKEIQYMLKGQGRFLALNFVTDEFPIVISLGIESVKTPALLDLSGWIARALSPP